MPCVLSSEHWLLSPILPAFPGDVMAAGSSGLHKEVREGVHLAHLDTSGPRALNTSWKGMPSSQSRIQSHSVKGTWSLT